ncbi:MAG TPA: 50S ribosomal protein L20 [Acidobacteriota bacterium]|nr:50S ribosomal protein L20 [Acidobacteriota bacterium]
MPRVKRGNKRLKRRKRILRQTKGYWGTKSKLHKAAKEQLMRSLAFAYRDRRQKKRTFRNLWIIRINAAVRQHGLSYSQFVHGLREAGVSLNRKVLADIAVRDPKGFEQLVSTAKKSIG